MRILMTLLLALALPAAAAPFTITLQLEESSLLPGVPAYGIATLRNETDEPVTLPEHCAVRVTPPSGEPFYAGEESGGVLWEQMWRVWYTSPKAAPTLPPRGEVTIDFAFSDESLSSAIAREPRLHVPGRYSIQLICQASKYLKRDESRSPRPVFDADAYYTNTAVLEILTPKGRDALAWQKSLELTNGRGLGLNTRQIDLPAGRQLWEEFKDTAYGPWFALFREIPSTPEGLQRLEEVISHPATPKRLQLKSRLTKAFLIDQIADGSPGGGRRVETLLKYGDLARAEIARVRSETNSRLIHAQAQRLEAMILPRERLLAPAEKERE